MNMSEPFDPFSRHRGGKEPEGQLGPEPIKRPIERPIKRHGADPKLLLTDILTYGPVPATIIEGRGAAHGLTRKQLRYAREQMNIVAFKEVGARYGRWLWALPQ
jgi:hypothetical protein